MARVIVLGGGFGGIAAATRLRDLLPRSDEVVLVDRRRDFVMGLRKTWAVVGSHPLEEGVRPLSRLSGSRDRGDRGGHRGDRPGDPHRAARRPLARGRRPRRRARGRAGSGAGPGPRRAWDQRLGPRRSRSRPRRARGSRRRAARYRCLRPALRLSAGAVRVGPPGATSGWRPGASRPRSRCSRRCRSRSRSSGATESAKIEAVLAAAGVAFLRGRRAVEVRDSTVRFEGGEERPFDLLFAVPPHRCPGVLVEAGLAAPGGWVAVDPRTLATSFPGVYAVGDCTAIMLAHGLPLPKAGVFAEAEGYVAARADRRRARGDAVGRRLRGRGCLLCGGRRPAGRPGPWSLPGRSPRDRRAGTVRRGGRGEGRLRDRAAGELVRRLSAG